MESLAVTLLTEEEEEEISKPALFLEPPFLSSL
jgi:hypothetical protein